MITVGIVGLGMIGGSLAKAYKKSGQATVLGHDADASIKELARLSGVIDGILTRDALCICDLILLAIPTHAVIHFIRDHADDFTSHPLLIDCAETKRAVCDTVFPIAQTHGLLFVGGHPIVNTDHIGFGFSRTDLFVDTPMVLVPPTDTDIRLLDRARALLAPIGFGHIVIMTASDHDRRIAYVSQLAQIVSNAYIQSPTAAVHKGFSTEGCHDLTSAASCNADMLTEQFLENSDYLLTELDTLITCLQDYRNSIAVRDIRALHSRLRYGIHRAQEIDGI